MKTERWERISQLYHAALSCGESERRAFLVRTCAGDLALRREVEALLAQQASASGFLTQPALVMAANVVSDPSQLKKGLADRYRIERNG